MFDGEAFGREIVGAVKAHVADVMAPIVRRLDAIELKLCEPAAVSSDDISAVKYEVDALRKALAELPEPVAVPELPDIPAMIAAEVAKIPVPQDGKDADPEIIKAMVAEAVAAIPPAQPGKDADPVEVAALVKAEAERILAGWERPQDGKSVTTDDMRPLVDEAVSKAVSAIPVPKDGAPGKDGRDGCDVVDAMQDKDGNLVVSFSDGRMKNVGLVCGKDGLNGTAGKDGRDGFSLENFDAELMKDGRTVLLKFEQGERAFAVELGIPAMIYRGVYREDEEYAKGDTVTYGGSLWHCDAETVKGMKPDAIGEQKSWTLCAKKGRDGKDGIIKAEAKPVPVKV